MKRAMLAGVAGLSCLALLAAAGPAQGLMIAAAPIGQRVVTADVVVVGKVTSIEEKTIKAERFPGDKEKGEYQIAVVKIEDAVLGAKGITHVRVGFIPPQVGGPIRPGRPGIRSPVLAKDQEVCLFLTQHTDGTFYTAPAYFDVIDKKSNENFDKEVAEAKKAAKLIGDIKAGFESKDANDRFLTAALLLIKHRTPKPSATPPKEEPIAAEESKKILQTLADADWAPPKNPTPFQLTPQTVFYRLALTEKDGFTPPKDFKQFPDEAKKWLKDNADKYRIKRFVAEEKKEKEK